MTLTPVPHPRAHGVGDPAAPSREARAPIATIRVGLESSDLWPRTPVLLVMLLHTRALRDWGPRGLCVLLLSYLNSQPTPTKRGSETPTPPSSASTKVTVPFTGWGSFIFSAYLTSPSTWVRAETPPPLSLHLFNIYQQTVSETLQSLSPLPPSTPLARTPILDPQVISLGRDPFLPAP